MAVSIHRAIESRGRRSESLGNVQTIFITGPEALDRLGLPADTEHR